MPKNHFKNCENSNTTFGIFIKTSIFEAEFEFLLKTLSTQEIPEE